MCGCRRAFATRVCARPSRSAGNVKGACILVLSQYVEERATQRSLLATGAEGVGYLLKDRVADVGEFVTAVRRVAGKGTVLVLKSWHNWSPGGEETIA